MPNSEAFERLLRKALQTQDLPPIPVSIQKAWQQPRIDSGAKWVWLLPTLIFILGLATGSALAPLGLSTVFISVKSALLAVWQSLPENTLAWAGVLLLGVLVMAFDSIRSAYRRLK
jgi:hypothetical protein